MKRKLSFPVSRMWQRWVRRSRSAVAILASPKSELSRRHWSEPDGERPFVEAEVGGDDDAVALIELAEQMKEQRPA